RAAAAASSRSYVGPLHRRPFVLEPLRGLAKKPRSCSVRLPPAHKRRPWPARRRHHMRVSTERIHRILRGVVIAVDCLVGVALVAVGALLWLEHGWAQPKLRGPSEAFHEGTIGTELVPLPVVLVLPDLFPEQFQPAGKDAGDWIDQFGFIRTQANGGLPIG